MEVLLSLGPSFERFLLILASCALILLVSVPLRDWKPGWPGARVGGSQPQHPEPAGRAVTERQAVGRGDRPGLGDSACRATSPRSGKLSGRGGGVGVGERPGAGV